LGGFSSFSMPPQRLSGAAKTPVRRKRPCEDDAVSTSEAHDARSEGAPSEPRPTKKAAKFGCCDVCQVKPSTDANNWADCETNERGRVVPKGAFCSLEAEFASSMSMTLEEFAEDYYS
jgi:hypothetical protein